MQNTDNILRTKGSVDATKFPHVVRWSRTVRALKAAYPLRLWPRSGSFGAQGGGASGSSAKKEDGPQGPNMDGLLKNAVDGKVRSL